MGITGFAEKYVRVEMLAKLAELSVRRIQQLTQDGIIETIKKNGNKNINNVGKYPLYDSINKLLLHYRKRADKNQGVGEDLEREKYLMAKANRKLAENKLALTQGDAHYGADVEAIFGDMLIKLKTRILSIPSACAIKVVNENDVNVCADILTNAVQSALFELSEYSPEMFLSENGNYVNDIECENDEDNEMEYLGAADDIEDNIRLVDSENESDDFEE